MSDLIDRQAAIRETWREPTYYDPLNVMTEMRDRLEALPSAQPEQRWIPCSERLPRKKCRYMVTRYDYVTKKEFIDIMWYEKKIWWNVHPMGGDYAVTAWMPLPEPHKGKHE